MSEPFIGEIRMFAGNFAPRGWALCDGQSLAIKQHDALFSLFGTTYGGDGSTDFALPDLRGRAPIHAGGGPGLSPRTIGEAGGAEQVTVTLPELPSHGHALHASTNAGATEDPSGKLTGQPTEALYLSDEIPPIVDLNPATVGEAGGSGTHANMMPFLCVNFIVALSGVYPTRQ